MPVLPSPQAVVRPVVVVLLFALAILYASLVPVSLQHGSYIGIYLFALACLSVTAAVELARRDTDWAWALVFHVGMLSVATGLVKQAIGLPLVADPLWLWGWSGEVWQLTCATLLAVLASWQAFRYYPADQLAAGIAFHTLTATHLGLLPGGVRVGAFFCATQLFVLACCLMGPPVILGGNIGAWSFTLTMGAVNTTGHVLNNTVGRSLIPMYPSPWWQLTIVVNAFSGAFLAILAARWLLGFFRSPAREQLTTDAYAGEPARHRWEVHNR